MLPNRLAPLAPTFAPSLLGRDVANTIPGQLLTTFAMNRFEKAYIAAGVAEDFRGDGRSCADYRPFTVETGVVLNTDGSARVKQVSPTPLPFLVSIHTSLP